MLVSIIMNYFSPSLVQAISPRECRALAKSQSSEWFSNAHSRRLRGPQMVFRNAYRMSTILKILDKSRRMIGYSSCSLLILLWLFFAPQYPERAQRQGLEFMLAGIDEDGGEELDPFPYHVDQPV